MEKLLLFFPCLVYDGYHHGISAKIQTNSEIEAHDQVCQVLGYHHRLPKAPQRYGQDSIRTKSFSGPNPMPNNWGDRQITSGFFI